MKKKTRVIRKLAVAVVGFPLLAVGLILIPLPGPGVLISLLAFFVLSLEFDWAQKYFDKAKAEFLELYKTAKERADKLSKDD